MKKAGLKLELSTRKQSKKPDRGSVQGMVIEEFSIPSKKFYDKANLVLSNASRKTNPPANEAIQPNLN